MSTVNSVSGFLGIILHFNLQIVLASSRVSALKINLVSLFPKRTNRKDDFNKTPKVVSVGCVGLRKHNGVLSEFGKIRETGKMCHVMSIDE